MDAQAQGRTVETVSGKLSELNLDQLGQVFRMIVRQQDELVAKVQELARQEDSLRTQKAELVKGIAAYGENLLHLSELTKKREAERDALAGGTAAGAMTVDEITRRHGEAPGTVLAASSAKKPTTK